VPIIILPSPSGGSSGTSAATRVSETSKFFGEDIWYDVSQAGPDAEPDYVITTAGDYAIAIEREALRQALVRRAITDPDEWPTLVNYGVGALSYVKSKNSASNRAALEARIRAQFPLDPRVESVDTVTITSAEGGGVDVFVLVIPVGALRNDKPLPVRILIT
jgi:hypothetical protein